MSQTISSQVFDLASGTRYIAVNQNGQIVEMERSPRWPSHNPADTDRRDGGTQEPGDTAVSRFSGLRLGQRHHP